MLSPQLGRFLSRDPLPMNGEPDVLFDNNPFGEWLDQMQESAGAGLNTYEYVYNNPTNFVDPSGLKGQGQGRPGPVRPGPVRRPPPPKRGDWLDCMANCVSANDLNAVVVGATGAGAIRVPKRVVHPGQYPTTNILTKKVCRRVTGQTMAQARFAGRGFLALLIFEGFYDIGAELACVLICNDLYPGVSDTQYRP